MKYAISYVTVITMDTDIEIWAPDEQVVSATDNTIQSVEFGESCMASVCVESNDTAYKCHK